MLAGSTFFISSRILSAPPGPSGMTNVNSDATPWLLLVIGRDEPFGSDVVCSAIFGILLSILDSPRFPQGSSSIQQICVSDAATSFYSVGAALQGPLTIVRSRSSVIISWHSSPRGFALELVVGGGC